MNLAESIQPKVLLVDDQVNNLVALRRLLATVDADLYTARSGQEALRLADVHAFALVLLDVQMPEMDGFAVAERLHEGERAPAPPIIFLTAARCDESHRIQGYHAGAVDYLYKPINDVVLLSKVRIFLDLHRHRVEQERLSARVHALNATLQTVNRNLEQKVNDLEGFSYTLSHDLRAPLRAINGFAGILREEFAEQLGEGGESLLGGIQNNSLRLSRLLDDLQVFFRVTSAPFSLGPVDLDRLVRQVTHACLEDERYRDAAVVIDSLPMVTGDETALRLMFHNLIENALKYSAAHDRPQIEVGTLASEAEVHCFVRDNGIGFDSRYSNKLFKVFERLVAGTDYEGTGVGLAIVDRIVRRHQGRVWAEGVPGHGATFHIALPRQNPEHPVAIAPPL